MQHRPADGIRAAANKLAAIMEQAAIDHLTLVPTQLPGEVICCPVFASAFHFMSWCMRAYVRVCVRVYVCARALVHTDACVQVSLHSRMLVYAAIHAMVLPV